LDNFKSVNDVFGHEAGDTVVKRFAEILNASTRGAEICARIGGDEFMIAITHTGKKGVQLAVERIRKKLAEQRFRFRGYDLGVTASFGIANHSLRHSCDLAGLMAQADGALYSAKRMGRNRVEIVSSELISVEDHRVKS
jgi:diguanylate cyclase (GGDEF)-like protein